MYVRIVLQVEIFLEISHGIVFLWHCLFPIPLRKVESRDEVRGEIARTYFYMDSVYPGKGIFSRKNRAMFEEWNRSDPVDEWEFERARRIERIQGNRNEIIFAKCLKK